MRNILNERPSISFQDLHGLPRYICQSVKPEDTNNKNILEIGIGYGWFLNFCYSQGAKKLTGIEYDDESLKTARDLLRETNAELKVANALELPFSQNEFDTVAAFEVLEHLPKNSEVLFFQQVRRVLKTSGVFYLSTPYRSFLATALDPAWWLAGHRHYSERTIRNLAVGAGFRIEHLEVRGGIWTSLYIINLYISKWIFRRGVIFKDFFERNMNQEFQRPGNGNLIVTLRKL